MKTKKLKFLNLNKKVVSALDNEKVKGGTKLQHPSTPNTDCDSCISCIPEIC